MPLPKLRHLSPIAAIAVALTLAVSGAEATGAHAAVKVPAPSLTLESKICNIGPTPAERFATIRALVGAPATAGLSAALRFRVQERPDATSPWVTASTAPSDTAVNGWEITTTAGTALRFTKSFKPLDEGAQFRILVDARGFDSTGKAATKMVTKTYLCAQPQFTAQLQLVKASEASGSDGSHTVTVSIRNTGRLPSEPPVITVMDAQTRGVLGTVTSQTGVKGNTTTRIQVPITSCSASLYVTVQQAGDALADLTSAQSATIACGAARASRLTRR